MSSHSGFWSDLQERLQADSEFAQQYLLDWVKLTTVDRLVNKLDEERASMGMTKAGLARAIHRDPAAVRRLLSDASGNPTIESVSSIAAAIGFRLELVPMEESERLVVSEPLRVLADC